MFMTEKDLHTIHMSVKRAGQTERDILEISPEVPSLLIEKLNQEQDGTTIFYPRPNDQTIAGEETTVFKISWADNSENNHPYTDFTNRLNDIRSSRQNSSK